MPKNTFTSSMNANRVEPVAAAEAPAAIRAMMPTAAINANKRTTWERRDDLFIDIPFIYYRKTLTIIFTGSRHDKNNSRQAKPKTVLTHRIALLLNFSSNIATHLTTASNRLLKKHGSLTPNSMLQIFRISKIICLSGPKSSNFGVWSRSNLNSSVVLRLVFQRIHHSSLIRGHSSDKSSNREFNDLSRPFRTVRATAKDQRHIDRR